MRKTNFFERLRACVLILAFEQKEVWSERLAKVKDRLSCDEFWSKLLLLVVGVVAVSQVYTLRFYAQRYEALRDAYQEYYGYIIRSATRDQQTFGLTLEKFQTGYSTIASDNPAPSGMSPIVIHDHGAEINQQGIYGHYLSMDLELWHECRDALDGGELEQLSFTLPMPMDYSATIVICCDFMDGVEANGQISKDQVLYWWHPIESVFEASGGVLADHINRVALSFAKNILHWSVYDSVHFAFFATDRLLILLSCIAIGILIDLAIDLLGGREKIKNHLHNIRTY